jgi:tellurite methyltransferase
VQATIVGFKQDAAGDWIAELSCDHSQHMRHRPPWELRPWVTTEAGRALKRGAELDCPLCDQITMPPHAVEYKRTATFTEQTLPAALRADHRTKPGTWARIVVEDGALEYHVRGRVHRLTPGAPGLVEPERTHHVTPLGPVRVHVEFWRVDEAGPERDGRAP